MQLHLVFSPDTNEIELPLHYNRLVQALVYKLMGPHLASFVHSTGFKSGDRSLRLFAFSRLLGNYQINRQDLTIRFNGEVRLIVASPIGAVLQEWATSLVETDFVMLGKNKLRLAEVRVEDPIVKTSEIKIQTASPISVYSTLYRKDGAPFTCFFEPGQPEFNQLISRNLQNKAEALGLDADVDNGVNLVPLGRLKPSLVKYKGGVIKGVSGTFEALGDPKLLQVGLNAGFGAKNSQGFGLCILKGG